MQYSSSSGSCDLVIIEQKNGKVIKSYGPASTFHSGFKSLSSMAKLNDDIILCLSYYKLIHFSLKAGKVVHVAELKDRPKGGVMNDDIRLQTGVDHNSHFVTCWWWTPEVGIHDPITGKFLYSLSADSSVIPEGSQSYFVATPNSSTQSNFGYLVSYGHEDFPNQGFILLFGYDRTVKRKIEFGDGEPLGVSFFESWIFTVLRKRSKKLGSESCIQVRTNELDPELISVVTVPTQGQPFELTVSEVGIFVQITPMTDDEKSCLVKVF